MARDGGKPIVSENGKICVRHSLLVVLQGDSTSGWSHLLPQPLCVVLVAATIIVPIGERGTYSRLFLTTADFPILLIASLLPVVGTLMP